MNQKFLRPADAAKYLTERYGFGAARSLAKWRTLGGGPAFRKAGRLVLYEPGALDAWAASRISNPLASTSEVAQ